MQNVKKSFIFAGLAVLLWSTVATAFELALEGISPVALVFYASSASLFALALILAFTGKFKEFRTQSKKEILISSGLGLLNPAGYYFCLFGAYDLLPAQEALALNYTWAVVLALLSVPLLKQKLTIKALAGLLISFFGVVLISSKGNFNFSGVSNLGGVFLALSSSVIWALYWIFNVKDNRDSIVKLSTNFIFGTFYSLIAFWLIEGISIPELKSGIASVYVGFFEMGITFFLWLNALKYAKSSASVGSLIYLSPVLSLFFISYFLEEPILISTVVGLAIIITGIIIAGSKKNSLSN
jgi:drug/metabolite transporter (DMT)-like permease